MPYFKKIVTIETVARINDRAVVEGYAVLSTTLVVVEVYL